jgi:DNA-binding transcriptional ArsR family regulator
MKRPPSATECSELLKAVADRERLRIVRLLRDGPRSVGDLASALGLTVQNTSHHLKLLRKTGLVATSKVGRFVLYSLAPKYAPRQSKRALDVLDFGCCRIEFQGP